MSGMCYRTSRLWKSVALVPVTVALARCFASGKWYWSLLTSLGRSLAVLLVTVTLCRLCHWQCVVPVIPGDISGSGTGHYHPHQVMSVILVTATLTR